MAPLALGSGWLAGSYGAEVLALSVGLAVPLAALLLLGAGIGWRVPALGLTCLFIAAFLGGYARTTSAMPPSGSGPEGAAALLGPYYGTVVAAWGVVIEEPERRGESKTFRVSVEELRPRGSGWLRLPVDVLVRTQAYQNVHYGDRVLIRGRLDEPWQPDGESYRKYLARRGIQAEIGFPDLALVAPPNGDTWMGWLYRLRGALAAALARALPEPAAALAQGILLGERGSFPPELAEAFVHTGTIHLIAISGFNISLVVGAVRPLSTLIARRFDWLICVLAITAYAILVGGQPSVVRAAIMGGLAVIARSLGRPSDALAWLSLAGAGMAAVTPSIIGDLGFQLSFLATLGLIVLAEPIQRRLQFLGTWLSQQVATTVAAESWVLPLLAQTFGLVSVVTLGANVLAAELVGPAMALAGLTAVLGAIWPPLGEVAGWFAWLVLSAFILVVTGFGSIPFAALPVGRVPDAAVLVIYTILVGIALARHDLPFRRLLAPSVLRVRGVVASILQRIPTLPLAGALAMAALVVWAGALCAPTPSGVRLTMLDLGRGEALLLQTNDGRTVLVDGSGNGNALVNALDRRLPFWRRQIDIAILTAFDDSRLAGLIELAERDRLRHVLQPPMSGVEIPTAAQQRWQALLEERGVTVTEAVHGQEIRVGDELRLRVLHPQGRLRRGETDDALALLLEVGPTTGLLLGALSVASQERLAETEPLVTFLTIPHDGRSGSLSPTLLRALQPREALVTIAARQGRRYPATETLGLLGDRPLYRTDLHGSIEVDFTLEGYTIRTQRGAPPHSR